MRVIIFNDTQNFNGSLNFINEKFNKNEKRFWNYKKYIPFLIKKINSIDNLNKEDFQLIKTYFYEGKYSSKVISGLKWSTNQEISKINRLIGKEKSLLDIFSKHTNISKALRRKVYRHIESIKTELEEEKEKYSKNILKQERNFGGQRGMIEELEENPLIDLRCTPLKQKEGEIYQKGVDVLLATDLVHLAHTDAYDIAIILSGDTDLIEAVRLIKNLGKTPIIFSYHTPGNPKKSNISDLMNAGKFINMKDFTDEEIFEMSDLREKKD